MMEAILDEEQELVPASDPRSGLISIDPGRMSGAPCFSRSRVPIKHLWDYLEVSETLEEFAEDFQGIPREQLREVLWLAYEHLLDDLPSR